MIYSKLKALELSQHFSHYKSIRDSMVVLVTCKNEEDTIKIEGARVVTALSIDFSDAQGQLTPKSVMESCQNSNSSKLLWLVLLSARMKRIHPKMNALEWSQYFSHYKSMGIFPDAQGQLTHKSLVGSCRISNLSKMLWLSLLPAIIKMNQSKIKKLEWSQGFPNYNPMGAICCHGNQSSDPIWPQTSCSQIPNQMMLQMKFDYDWPAGLRDIHV